MTEQRDDERSGLMTEQGDDERSGDLMTEQGDDERSGGLMTEQGIIRGERTGDKTKGTITEMGRD